MRNDIGNEMMHVAQDLYAELEELIASNGKGDEPISRPLESILLSRVFDRQIDEIQYFLYKRHRVDAVRGLESLAATVNDVL